ncbi:Crp/Fnr family transcriptional regulator [Thermus thermamylovorans]|uniref:Crp/Fnr family transcriptional regulator n=1 Tax=Thermus thermamylovorans TaxID=2509362 RepID=A0A4V2IUZ8_9DEIN|nr:Crp/Fnr family transcriptional regulator [Thermus thermamylovorans]TBH20067.1 Crp/Fnr family transcriptional regulator [Thermus thermamylovorans]
MDLSQVPLFRELGEADLKALRAEARPRALGKGELLFLEGEPVQALFVVRKGLIKVYKLDPEGRKQVVLHVEGPGRVLAEVALFLERPTYPASAEALEASEVLVIPKERFFQLVEARPPLARALIRYLARRQGQLLHLLDRLVFHEVRERLCEYLLEKLKEEGQGFRLPTNPELAALLGTVPEAVSRNLGELYRRGLIRLAGRQVEIPDPQALRGVIR